MNSYFYSNTIQDFLTSSTNEIFGTITRNSDFPDEPTQKGAWNEEIRMLKEVLANYQGRIFFEYSIPRMGRRIDVVLIIKNVIFVVEFKVGEKDFYQSAVDQVWDYALDLKNFHEMSHAHLIAPVLVCTESKRPFSFISEMPHNDNLLFPIKANEANLEEVIKNVLAFADGENINQDTWA